MELLETIVSWRLLRAGQFYSLLAPISCVCLILRGINIIEHR